GSGASECMLAAGAERGLARPPARRLPVEAFGGDELHERVRALMQARELFVEAANDLRHWSSMRGRRPAEASLRFDAAVFLFKGRAEDAPAIGGARIDAPLDADARAARGHAALRDDPNPARAVVNLVGPADERHAVAVGHAARQADLLVHVAVRVSVDLPDVRLVRTGRQAHEQNEQKRYQKN